MPIQNWLSKLFAQTSRRSPRRRPRARPVVEFLEDRTVPSTFNEVEPNDTAALANVVPIATGDILTTAPNDWLTINGSIATGTDNDYFQFTLAARSGVFFDIDAQEIGLSSLDSIVTLYSSNGTTVVASNDDGYDFEGFATPINTGSGPLLRDSSLYADLAAGTYFVAVTSFQSSSSGAYQLRLLADTNYSSTVPVLNSRPGAPNAYFLDFDGHAASDAWGTYTAAAFDLNGTAGEFTPAERLSIRNTWRIISEDYSPFNLNVTTVAPLFFSDGVAFRQVLTNSDAPIVGVPSGTLGVAFLNSFAGGGPSNNVSFTFAANFGFVVGGTGISGQIMAASVERGNTSSHELGHALGLQHYATSNGSAGPADVIPNAIMATPDQGFNREIWGRGVSQAGTAQDDVAVISNGFNSIGLVPDDHGDTTATARILTATGGTYTASGVIRQTTDLDVFRFGAGGTNPTTIRVDVDDYVSNLNVAITLLDSGGNVIATADDPNSFDALISMPLNGIYFLVVTSSAQNAAQYSEIGQYTLTINTVLGNFGTPTTTDLNLTTSEDTDVSGTLPATDPDGNQLTYTIVTPPANGTITSFNPGTGQFTYRPNPDYFNTAGTPDTFTFRASNAANNSNVSTVRITVNPVDDPLRAVVPAGPLQAFEDTPFTLTGVSVVDVDGDQTSVVATLTVGQGTITVSATAPGGLTAGQITGNGTSVVQLTGTVAAINATLAANPQYRPVSEYSGLDTLILTADVPTDSSQFDVRTVTINVNEVNDPPTAGSDALPPVLVGTGPITIPIATLLTNDSPGPINEAGQTLTLVAVSAPVGGTVNIVGSNIVFTPQVGFTGAASFSYNIIDNGTTGGAPDPQTATGTVTFNILTVLPPPPPPGGGGGGGGGTPATPPGPVATGLAPRSFSFAVGPTGLVAHIVSASGVLTQFDAFGSRVLASGIRSSSVTFGPQGQVMLIVTDAGALFQVGGGGVFQMAAGGIRDAEVSFGSLGAVYAFTNEDGTLVQVDSTGSYTIATGVMNAAMTVGPFGPVYNYTTASGQLVRYDFTGGSSIVTTGARAAALPGGSFGDLSFIVLVDGTLVMGGAFGLVPLGRLPV